MRQQQRKGVWVPGAVISGTAAVVWTIAGGLASCDSTARFTVTDTKFAHVQAVSAFPAYIDEQTGQITRVCGAPLPDADGNVPEGLTPNGFELVTNLVANEVKQTACPDDKDLGVAEDERIELQLVTTKPGLATIGPQSFQLDVQQLNTWPAGSPTAAKLAGKALRYRKIAERCTPTATSTWQNVAMVIDHSGSTAGFVDESSNLEYPVGAPILPPSGFKLLQSDPYNDRINGSIDFIDSLNRNFDRIITYFFDEKIGVEVACSDAKVCFSDPNNKKCLKDSDCGNLGPCAEDPSLASDTIGLLPTRAAREAACFGSKDKHRTYATVGLNQKAKLAGEGRAPMWSAVDRAFSFLHTDSKISSPAKHLILLTDGPDTCTHEGNGENFTWKDLSGKTGKCSAICQNAEADYKTLVNKLNEAGWPVHVHVIQFQSSGYSRPDARLQEIACRSQGTYQFLNTNDFVRDDPTSFSLAFRTALNKIRYGLKGNWRVGFKYAAIDDVNAVPRGQVMRIDGSLKMSAPAFPSLDSVYVTSDSWNFGLNGEVDRALLFRRPCKDHADCGGTGPCGANFCSEAGVCVPSPAPNMMPCGDNKVCCSGACTDKCDCK